MLLLSVHHFRFPSMTVLRDCMQDGALPHIARQVTALFRTHFVDERVISRGFQTELPPRSPD